jgi:tRNA 2-thiouridine synthesizing protein E
MNDVLHPRGKTGAGPEFPHAPADWTRQDAENTASTEGLVLGADHWDAVRALQEYFARQDSPGVNARKLCDALDERFHSRGGLKYLYTLFPGGPISQGCRLAGIEPPAGSRDCGFGSVQ